MGDFCKNNFILGACYLNPDPKVTHEYTYLSIESSKYDDIS